MHPSPRLVPRSAASLLSRIPRIFTGKQTQHSRPSLDPTPAAAHSTPSSSDSSIISHPLHPTPTQSLSRSLFGTVAQHRPHSLPSFPSHTATGYSSPHHEQPHLTHNHHAHQNLQGRESHQHRQAPVRRTPQPTIAWVDHLRML